MCLVAFQKMFWKIFFDVWLCSWKYHRKHIFYLLLTFSRLPNKYIISFISQNTNKTQKKIIKSGHFARSWSARRLDRDRRFAWLRLRERDRDWSFTRSRSARCQWYRRSISASSALDDLYSLFFLSPFLSFSHSLSLLRVTWKWFEGRMKV